MITKIFRVKQICDQKSCDLLDGTTIQEALNFTYNSDHFEVQEIPDQQEELDRVREALRDEHIHGFEACGEVGVLCTLCDAEWYGETENHNQVDYKGRKVDCPAKLPEEVKENG